MVGGVSKRVLFRMIEWQHSSIVAHVANAAEHRYITVEMMY